MGIGIVGIDLAQKIPKIEIDHSRCTVPFLCKKCLRICPQAVFLVDVIKVERLRETEQKEPGTYRLRTESLYKCTGCNQCIEVCPVDAITITWPQ